MLKKYHINTNGIPVECKVIKGSCPFGNDEQHFNSLAEAKEFINTKNEKYYSLQDDLTINTEDKMLVVLKRDGSVPLVNGQYYYKIAKVNSENFEDMTEKVKRELKEEGLYNNSYISGIFASPESEFTSEVLPFNPVGAIDKKFYLQTPEEVISRDMNDVSVDMKGMVDDITLSNKEERRLKWSKELEKKGSIEIDDGGSYYKVTKVNEDNIKGITYEDKKILKEYNVYNSYFGGIYQDKDEVIYIDDLPHTPVGEIDKDLFNSSIRDILNRDFDEPGFELDNRAN